MRDKKNMYMPYNKRLQKLGTLSLEKRCLYADLAFVYKALHWLFDCGPSDFDQKLNTSCTRGDGMQLNKHRATSQAASHEEYSFRLPPQWNTLPLVSTGCNLAGQVKRQLKKHFLSSQFL